MAILARRDYRISLWYGCQKNAEKYGILITLSNIALPVFTPNQNDPAHNSQTLFYRLVILIFVKLPSFVGIAISGDSKALIRFIDLKGDFQKPVE